MNPKMQRCKVNLSEVTGFAKYMQHIIWYRDRWVANLSEEKMSAQIFHSCRQQIWRSFRCPLSSKWFPPARPFSLNTSVTVTAVEIHSTQDHLLHLRGPAHSPFKLLLYFPLIHSALYSYCQSCLDISDSHLSPEDNLLLCHLEDTVTDRHMRMKFWKTPWFAGEVLFMRFHIIVLCKQLSSNDRPLFMRIRN